MGVLQLLHLIIKRRLKRMRSRQHDTSYVVYQASGYGGSISKPVLSARDKPGMTGV